jgi:hypothetical protein
MAEGPQVASLSEFASLRVLRKYVRVGRQQEGITWSDVVLGGSSKYKLGAQ